MELTHRLSASAMGHADFYDARLPSRRRGDGADATARSGGQASLRPPLGGEGESRKVRAVGTLGSRSLVTGWERRPGLQPPGQPSPSKPVIPIKATERLSRRILLYHAHQNLTMIRPVVIGLIHTPARPRFPRSPRGDPRLGRPSKGCARCPPEPLFRPREPPGLKH